MNWLKEIWRLFVFLPIGIVIIYFGAKIIDESPSLQFILQVLGILFLVDITWKVIGEERQKKQETEKLEKIEKKYFDK